MTDEATSAVRILRRPQSRHKDDDIDFLSDVDSDDNEKNRSTSHDTHTQSLLHSNKHTEHKPKSTEESSGSQNKSRSSHSSSSSDSSSGSSSDSSSSDDDVQQNTDNKLNTSAENKLKANPEKKLKTSAENIRKSESSSSSDGSSKSSDSDSSSDEETDDKAHVIQQTAKTVSSSSSSSSDSSDEENEQERTSKKREIEKTSTIKCKVAKPQNKPIDHAQSRDCERSSRDTLIVKLLARWWYVLPPWPPETIDYQALLAEKKFKLVSIDEYEDMDDVDKDNFTKVYQISTKPGVFRDPQGNAIDMRPLEGKPCFKTFENTPSKTLRSLIVTAMQNQLKALDNSHYDEKFTKRYLEKQIAKLNSL